MTAAQINGNSFDPEVSLAGTWDYDSIQEWTISNSGAHPYHLHVYHMQAVGSGCDGGVHDQGEYYDTISAPSNCVVRFHMIDYGGSVMMHCHVLKHEDNGSMTWVDVIGGPAQSPVDDRDEQTCALDSQPTSGPSMSPSTGIPTPYPTIAPSRHPTEPPTSEPTPSPSQSTDLPTSHPTELPTVYPTQSPSQSPDPPTVAPTHTPTRVPTAFPSDPPTSMPTSPPSIVPTTLAPTDFPTSTCAASGNKCYYDSDCCSDNCSNGRPADRVCLGNGRLLRGRT